MARRKFEYVKGSDVRNKSLKSLILMIRDQNGSEVATAFCLDKDWQVILSGEGEVKFLWEEFLEIFYQVSLFVTGENEAMLRECEENVRDTE